MTYEELIYKARYIIGDTIEPYLVSDEEFTVYIELILNYFLSETNLYPTEETINVLATTEKVTIPNSSVLLDVRDVKFDGEFLTQIDFDVAQQFSKLSGIPKFYTFENASKSIFLYPKPDKDGQLSYVRSNGVSINSLSDQIPIPAQYHLFLLDGILWKVYDKADSELADQALSLRYVNQFEVWINRVKKYSLLSRQGFNTRVHIHGGLL